MGDEAGWCTIESDPGVFTELLRSIGVKNVQVDEIYSLDRDELARHGRVHGLVFLFKYRDNERESARQRAGRVVSAPDELFFANQTIRNACATQAILSIVLNAPGIAIGDELQQFKEFSHGMDGVTRGMVISNSDTIRAAHNSFAVQHALEVESNDTGAKEDPFHFVAFIPWKGKVYELDGLQDGPRELGDASEKEWLDVVAPLLTSRIEEYGETEIRFNIMVVVEDPREKLQAELDRLREGGDDANAMRGAIECELQMQKEKHERWEVEIARRRWNFMPLIFGLLKTLANAGQVGDVIEAAEERKKETFREMLAKKAREGQS